MLQVTNTTETKKEIDIFKEMMKFKKVYRNVYIYMIDNQPYIYRTLGRKEYKDILSDNRFDDFEKEEIICDTCLLLPSSNEIDWNNTDAGIATELMKIILKNSHLDTPKARRKVLDYYRTEMYDLDNQATCIISEAFPSLDIEDIEEWDIEKTMKYLSRAEWKLVNLHGLHFKEPEGEFYDEHQENNEDETQYTDTPHTEEINLEEEGFADNKPKQTIRGTDKGEKLTPDKIREREEFLRKFPQFANLHDDGMDGMQGFSQDGVDTTSPALRPGWGF